VLATHELSVKDVPIIVSPTCDQPSVPLSERSNLYDTAPPTGVFHDSAMLVAVWLGLVKLVGELGSVVVLVADVGAEVPDTLTAETL